MDIPSLRTLLSDAYSPENLNKIADILIKYYQNKEFSILQRIAMLISEFVPLEIDDSGK